MASIQSSKRQLKDTKQMSLQVGDRVHAGLREKGGSGFYGTIRKIEGTTVHIFTGPSAFGDLIVKSTIDLVSKEEEIVKNT